MIQDKLQKIINRQLEKTLERDFNGDYVSFAHNFYEITQREIHWADIIEGILTYIIEIKDVDPFVSLIEIDWFAYEFNGDDMFEILNGSGWIDKYFTLDYYKSILNVYRDIQFEGKKIYLLCNKWEELSDLFMLDSQNWVERILSDEGSEIYGWFDVVFESDVWDNLDEKSLQHIKEYIIENDFIGKEFESVEDPDGEGLRLDMLEETDLLGELIDNEHIFHDLKSELKSFYRWAYETAAESELFGAIVEEVEQLLGSKGEWEVKKSNKNGISDRYLLKFDITNIFMEYNLRYLKCSGEFPEHNENYFLNVISQTLSCEGEKLSGPSENFYPDSNRVSQYFNENVLGNL